MGYYISLTHTNATIPLLNRGAVMQRFDRWQEDNPDASQPPLDFAEEVLEEIGFDVYSTDNKAVHITGYEGKYWYKLNFIVTICDLFTPGSFMNWHGGENDIWRWELGGPKLIELEAHISWENPKIREMVY